MRTALRVKNDQMNQHLFQKPKTMPAFHTLLTNIFGVPTALAQAAASAEKSSNVSVLTFIIEKLPLWISAVLIFGLSLVVGSIVKSLVEHRLASKIEEEHQEILIISGRIAFIGVMVIGITVALAIAGINITSLLAAVGFGISFGMQDAISNFTAGIGILATRPFTIGDWIKIGGNTGKVVEIRTRATYLRTYDGLRLIVPNAELYKSQVLSYTSNPMRRLKVPVYCRYGVPFKEVMEICLKEVRKNQKIYLEPKPNVIITDLSDSYIALQVRFWVDSKGMWRRIQSSMFMNIQNRLEEAGYDSPYAVTSITMEPDIESFILKTKNIDPDEFTKIMDRRVAEEAAYAKKREELFQHEPHQVQPSTVDQSGGVFLSAQKQFEQNQNRISEFQNPDAPYQNQIIQTIQNQNSAGETFQNQPLQAGIEIPVVPVAPDGFPVMSVSGSESEENPPTVG